MNRNARRKALVVGLIVSAAWTNVVSAQEDAPSKIDRNPAEKYVIAPGGVDMRTGSYVYRATDLSIGGDAGQLDLTRTMDIPIPGHPSPFGNFSSSLDITIGERRVQPDSEEPGGDFRIYVHFGGRTETFQSPGAGYGFSHRSQGQDASLTSSGDRAGSDVVYTFVSDDGTTMTFRPLGNGECSGDAYRCAYVSEILQPDGTRLTFEYVNAGVPDSNLARLRSVISSRGYALLVEGSSDPSREIAALVRKACVINLAQTVLPADWLCPETAVASTYTYEGSRLASVTGPDGQTSLFQVEDLPNGGYKLGFVKPGNSEPWLTNTFFATMDQDQTPQVAVSNQLFADGRSYSYDYDLSPNEEGPKTIVGGSYSSSFGQSGTVRFGFPIKPLTGSEAPPCTAQCAPRTIDDTIFQQTSGPVEIVDALGASTTSDYCDPNVAQNLPTTKKNRCLVGLLRSFTNPEGIKTELTYASARNISQVRQIAKVTDPRTPDIVTSMTYDCSSRKFCAKPKTTTDANGNMTAYTYSADHGGVLTETKPAGENGIQAVIRHGYEQRSARISDGAGGYVAAASAVWLPATLKTCRATKTVDDACEGGATDEVVTTFDYGPDTGPDNLLVRGTTVTADGQSLRTCYRYDAQGNKIAETSPRAGLTTCP